jgi:acetyl esterase
MYDIAGDVRLDPRIKSLLSLIPPIRATDVESREAMVAEAASEAAAEAREVFKSFMDLCDTEEAAPSTGLKISTEQVPSSPDGNIINLAIIRPDSDETVPCVYYIHGGGMASLSCFDGMYRGWGKLIAANNVAVVMVDFRNCVAPSSVPEVAPFPAGLNDCVSGLKWVVAHAETLNIDVGRIIVAGESGGGNLTIATGLKLKQDGDLALIKGLYALCPYLKDGNPLAWPTFATLDDVAGFPPTVISVNECDPLRDEGLHFYRLLLQAGVPARGRQVMGTMHGTEIFTVACPEISRDTARDIAAFARS